MSFATKIGFIFVLVALSFSKSLSAQEIHIPGQVIQYGSNKKVRRATVVCFEKGYAIDSVRTSWKGAFDLHLPLGSQFSIKIKRRGYISKAFRISTKGIPEAIQTPVQLTLPTKIVLLKELPNFHNQAFGHPIFFYAYSAKNQSIIANREYYVSVFNALTDYMETYKAALERK